jgi:methyl-accepting chemotaxis protein
MSGEYLNVGVNSAEAFAVQCINDNTLKLYANGYYEDDIIESNSVYDKYYKSFLAKATTDEFISGVSILTANVKPISDKNLDNNIMDDFYNTELGQLVNDSPGTVIWNGSNEFLDEKLGKSYAIRYIRRFSETNAVIIIDLNKDVIQNNLLDLQLDQLGEVGFITSDGVEIIPSGEHNEKEVFTGQKFYNAAVSSDKSNDSYYVNKNGSEYLFIYSKIGNSGAMICTLIPQEVILSKANSIKSVTIIMVIISSIIAILVGMMISVGIDKTIKKINKDLDKAAKGDLTVQFHSKGRDELHILIHGIQNTFCNIKGLIHKVKELGAEVSSSSENVTKTSEEFLRSCDSISQAMNEIEQGINQQAKDAEECLQQMGGLSEKIEIVSDSTKVIRQIANDTRVSIKDGTTVTLDLDMQTKTTIGITSEIISDIEKLAVKSSSIAKIANVINDIVNQTKLLSLNASIEAARAGEFGKGFSVVAEEIGRLSEQSGNSIKDINNVIKVIEEDIKQASQTVKRVENVMVLQKEAVDNTISSYENINQNVEKLIVNLNGISTSVDNIEQARVNTLGAVESISAVLEEIASSSNNVSNTTHELLQSVGTLNKSAVNLNNNSDQMVEAVGIFRI